MRLPFFIVITLALLSACQQQVKTESKQTTDLISNIVGKLKFEGLLLGVGAVMFFVSKYISIYY